MGVRGRPDLPAGSLNVPDDGPASGARPQGDAALLLVASLAVSGEVVVRTRWTLDLLAGAEHERTVLPDEVAPLLAGWLEEARTVLLERAD